MFCQRIWDVVMFVMLTTVIVSATFAGMIGGFLVEKIFFTLAGALVYLYLFVSVPGSFNIDFAWIKEHPRATVTLVMFGTAVPVLAMQSFWPKVLGWWGQAKEGGQIGGAPGSPHFGLSILPEFARPGSRASRGRISMARTESPLVATGQSCG